MRFQGKYFKRSSSGSVKGPPGETEIQRLNPAREREILRVTGWKQLASGSLNLEVDDWVVEALVSFTPTLEEPGEGIFYPSPFEQIPKRLKGYWYYKAIARTESLEEDVLVRHGIVPLRGVVELFSAVPLANKFTLRVGDSVIVLIQSAQRANGPGA